MGNIVQRVKQLVLPEGEYLVIGSGLLDALNLRDAHDLDLTVSESLFETFAATGEYNRLMKYGSEVLEGNTDATKDIEIWKQWQEDLPFDVLIQKTVTVDGAVFAHPETIIGRKEARGLEKDLNDIRLLKEYYHYE